MPLNFFRFWRFIYFELCNMSKYYVSVIIWGQAFLQHIATILLRWMKNTRVYGIILNGDATKINDLYRASLINVLFLPLIDGIF